MSEINEIIYRNIARDMSAGLVVLNMDGTVDYCNPRAEEILGMTGEEMHTRPFAHLLFEDDGNDDFVQLILEAVYEKNTLRMGVVPYHRDGCIKQLTVRTSYLRENDVNAGVICMMDDITELTELKDAVHAMNEIRRLNESLTVRNRLLQKTFGRFLSDEIVKQMFETENGLALGGEKNELTVMMSDLRGFTALSERMDPYGLITMLNHYLGCMTRIIQKWHGTIIEFIGDGIMVVFGAPVRREDHAEEAVCAAIEMQKEMAEVNAWNASNGYPALEMGIGLHTGGVILGNIGSEERTKYGAVGSNVNLCGRIESCTTGGQVLISKAVYDRVKAPLTVDAEREISPKGSNELLTLYSVKGIGEPFGLSYSVRSVPPRLLPRPAEIRFACLEGKMNENERTGGEIVALSENEFILKTERPLSMLTNITFVTGRDAYAKVVELLPDGYRLRLTYCPPEFDRWLQERFEDEVK